MLECLAEAQSGLMATLRDVEFEDRDVQLPVFYWLRWYTQTAQVYLPQYLSRDRSASPEAWEAALGRQEEARRARDRSASQSKVQKTALNDIRFDARRFGALDEDERARVWKKIDASLVRYAQAGGDPEAGHVREAVAPLRGEAVPEGASDLLRSLLREREAREDDADEDATPTRAESAEIAAVRDVLRGRVMVLIGGIEKAKPRERLREAFDLEDVAWITTGEHESLSRFEPEIARPETAVVVVMIRWASHSYEGAKALAEKHGKLYLRLPRGYNPAQIAHEFLKQNSARAGVRTV
jgi:hypothetical protein